MLLSSLLGIGPISLTTFEKGVLVMQPSSAIFLSSDPRFKGKSTNSCQ